jgi:putative ABC transport system substrate-binding protein
MIKRRTFIAGMASAAAWPVMTTGQQVQAMPRIGLLSGFAEDALVESELIPALAQLGWENGRNVEVIQRWGAGDFDRIAVLAKELVASQPAVIITVGTPATVSVKAETETIPVVFLVVADPVGAGIVTSLPRPATNISGVANPEAAFGSKLLSLLKKVAPDIRHAAAVFNPDTAPAGGRYYLDSFMAAASSLSIEAFAAGVRSDADIEQTVKRLGQQRGGLVGFPDVFMNAHRGTVISLALQNKVPTIYDSATFAKEGGLLRYGASFAVIYRRTAFYVDRILRGNRPNELPVELPTKYEFVINLKTARAIGVNISADLLSIADEVIE